MFFIALKMWRQEFIPFAIVNLLWFSGVCYCASFSLLPLVPVIGGSNQALPPDASPIATPSFDVHRGKCPDIKFDCDNTPIRYYCSSDLACFSWQKCCLYSCSYYCTISSGWRNATEDATANDHENDAT